MLVRMQEAAEQKFEDTAHLHSKQHYFNRKCVPLHQYVVRALCSTESLRLQREGLVFSEVSM